jgi:hypothetical protein
MREAKNYNVILFNSVSHAMLAEKLLKSSAIQNKLIPVPRHISSDCGVCLRILTEDSEKVVEILEGKVAINEIRTA